MVLSKECARVKQLPFKGIALFFCRLLSPRERCRYNVLVAAGVGIFVPLAALEALAVMSLSLSVATSRIPESDGIRTNQKSLLRPPALNRGWHTPDISRHPSQDSCLGLSNV